MTIKKTTTVLMAAVIAVATVLAAGLAVLPSSVQDAQANPCASEVDSDNINNGFNPQAKPTTNANVISPATSNLMKAKHPITA
jgi:hypothetical protein